MSYATNSGKYQDKYQRIYKDLVPDVGNANSTEGELMRAANNAYAEFYQNKTKFSKWWTNNKHKYCFTGHGADFFLQFQPDGHKLSDYDKMMDTVIKYIVASIPAYKNGSSVQPPVESARKRKRRTDDEEEDKYTDSEVSESCESDGEDESESSPSEKEYNEDASSSESEEVVSESGENSDEESAESSVESSENSDEDADSD